MNNKTISIKAFKANKKLHRIAKDLIPKLRAFIEISEEYIFSYDFSEETIQLRLFCITNFLRLLMSELEKRTKEGELTQEFLESCYTKTEKTLSTLRKDAKEINRNTSQKE